MKSKNSWDFFSIYLPFFVMRIDKWIWATRMVKSRTLATQFCKLGKVLLNGAEAKAAKEIKVDDIITVNGKSSQKIYKVVGFIAKPSTHEKVAQYFEDLTPEQESQEKFKITEREKKKIINKKYNKDQGRPVKRDRRKLEKFRNEFE